MFEACIKTKADAGLKSGSGLQDDELSKNSLYDT